MIAETYSGANRLSAENRRELDKIASESLRESSGLLGQSRTLTKMASAISMQLTKVAKVAFAEDESMSDDPAKEMKHMADDADDYSDDSDDGADDQADDVADLMAKAMDLRRFRREQLVVEAAKKKDLKKDLKKDPKMDEKMKALRAKKEEEDDAKDMKAKAKAKAKAEEEKATAKAEKEEKPKKKASEEVAISKSAAFRDMVNDAFQTKKAEDDKDSYKIRLRRAYDVAIEMQKKGLLPISKTALDKQVDDIMEFDDRAFEAFKRTVANARTVETVKVASDLGGINVGVGSTTERAPTRTTSEILSLLWE